MADSEERKGPIIETPADSDTEVSGSGGSPVNEKKLLRKLDYNLLPAVGVLYLLSFLDRSNVGNARIEGMLDDLHMTGNQYLTGLTLYFVAYVIFEIPCNIILKRTSPRVWLPTLTIAWGIVATLLGVVQDMPGFFVARFFLGITESGLFPGVVYYFSMWYKRRERQYRISLFFSAASLAGAFGGVLAYGIGRMSGIVWEHGWRWIFILEGILTVLVAIAAYWFIHNYPNTAKFLTEAERRHIHERLAADSDATNDEQFSWSAVRDALKDVNCWLYGLGFHTMSLPLYTLSLFLPTIISSLGYTAAKAQLLTVPPYAFAFFTTIALAILSERTGQRALFIAGSSLFGAVGYAILLGNTHPGTGRGCRTRAPSSPRAASTRPWRCIGNLGAVLGTQLYRSADGPRFVVGHSFALAYLLANVIVVSLLWWRLRRENRRRDEVAARLSDGNVAAPVVEGFSDWKGDADPRWRFEY
ncbi:MFS transporter [Apiospora arundinis]